ncbi:MAG: metallophosphoesterase [Pirellulaceae bacterium]|nr:metallophosphoesterase [Pirellulaceae bacterium]
MQQHTYFVSDLHLFSRRSVAERHLGSIVAAAAEARVFVLGGDIFDFRWTRLDSIEQTIDAAVHWVDRLVAPHPRCEFHYVLGNHDSNRHFVRRLERLAARRPNLTCHHYWLRLGNSVFLHGDVADRPMDQQALAAQRLNCHDDRKRGRVSNLAYDVAVGARLHKVASHVVNRRPRVARHILSYLRDVGQCSQSGVRHVYFGHTHAAMSDYRYGGLTFHNGGAPIKGLEFRILRTHL